MHQCSLCDYYGNVNVSLRYDGVEILNYLAGSTLRILSSDLILNISGACTHTPENGVHTYSVYVAAGASAIVSNRSLICLGVKR